MTTLKDVADEVRAEIPSVDDDLTPPPHLMTSMVAHHRWQLRNTAALAGLNQRLARRRGDSKSAEAFGKQIDQHVKDIAELDREYPEAKKEMKKLDEKARLEQG